MAANNFHKAEKNLMAFRTYLKILVAALLACEGAKAETPQESYWSYSTTSQSQDASDLGLPLLSFILPGSGQWVRGQWASGAIYTGGAIASVAYALNAKDQAGLSKIKATELIGSNVAARKYLLGFQTNQAIGGLSLYHTFRSAVWQRKKFGGYGFLGSSETPTDLLKAPFQFEFLMGHSTYIPLGVAAVASWYQANHPLKGRFKKRLSREDPWFAGSFSYNAGVHEEAIFRGWLMPLLHENGHSTTSANLTQATAFALLHLGSNSLPIPQFLLGLHFGQTTIKNRWTISEAIFIHTWWDIMILLAAYHSKDNDAPQGRQASLHLPPLQFVF